MNEYPIDLLYNFPLGTPDDLFFEVLINNIRNEVTSYQDFIFKFKKRKNRYSLVCFESHGRRITLT
jgi:hypothetical protein